VAVSPGIWPAFQPVDLTALQKQFDEQARLINSDNVINYYANVKNIPIGIPVDLQGDVWGQTAVWGDSIKQKPTIGPYGHTTEFQVSVKIYSSLIGLLADRWFPELVVPQGRMRVRLRFQEPNIAFQTLMDPCRRVPGTSRDFIPYEGVTRTQTRTRALVGANYVESVVQSDVEHIGTAQDLKALAAGIHPIMVADYVPGSVFVDSIAMGKFPLPVLNLRALHYSFGSGTGIWKNYAGFGPEAFTFFEPLNVNQSTVTGSVAAAMSTGDTDRMGRESLPRDTKMHYEQIMNQEYGFTPNHGARGLDLELTSQRGTAVASFPDFRPTTVADVQYYSAPTDFSNRYLNGFNANNNADVEIWTKPKFNADGTARASGSSAPWYSDPSADEYQHHQTWNPFCIPIPQYVPIRYPWQKQSTRVLTEADYVNENEICFGTFLEASVAQVRRSHAVLYPLQVPDIVSSGLNERLTYIVKNIQIVTQQIILPRGTALGIIENALSGGIAIECRAWKEMESMLPQAESQKHLINMAAAFVTDITFLFRPVRTFQGDYAYGYNSFSFYNPFTAFSFTADPDEANAIVYNQLGGEPSYYNECVIANRVPFDIQLQIAAELLPRVPIDSINALIRNVRWGDQVFSDRDYMELHPHLHPSYLTSKGMAINTLQDGFWACFTPIECLNDQTITDNPYFVSLELSIRKKLRGARATGGCLPFFKPLDGTFHLSFNFETYMGHSDRMKTGIPIVNNNMFLKMEKCHLARTEQTQLLTVVNCDGKIVFERGGTMQFFT